MGGRGNATPWGATGGGGLGPRGDAHGPSPAPAGMFPTPGNNDGTTRFGTAPAFTRFSLGSAPTSSNPTGPGGIANGVNKNLDEKIVALADYQYNGASGGDRWRVKVRNYLIGKRPELLPVLRWIEQLGETSCDVATAKIAIDQYGMMVESDIEAISAAMWSFLSTCVSGTAMTIFESIEVLNGLEAWRQLHNHIQKGSATRRLTLREPAIHPRAARSEEEISMAITKWETDYKRYLEAGGRTCA